MKLRLNMKLASNWIRLTLVRLVIACSAIEIFSFVATRLGLFLVNETPRVYSGSYRVLTGGNGLDWRSETLEWGAWHKPNSISRHTSSCFDVTYRSNEYGMRGPTIPRASGGERIALLGDSFAEGVGVSEGELAATLVSMAIGVPVMNFGTALDFGPLQQYLLYRGLGKTFEHNVVIIFFLPANDFTDNDYAIWRRTGWTFVAPASEKERYRPYWRRDEHGGFTHFVPERAIRREDVDSSHSTTKMMRDVLVATTWTSNALRTALLLWRRSFLRERKRKDVQDVGYSGYLDSTVDQQHATLFYLQRIIDEARGKTVILVAIPTLIDYDRLILGSGARDQWWYRELSDLQKKRGLVFVDLFDFVPAREEFKTYFLPCDGHWSPNGNKWVAEILTKILSERIVVSSPTNIESDG